MESFLGGVCGFAAKYIINYHFTQRVQSLKKIVPIDTTQTSYGLKPKKLINVKSGRKDSQFASIRLIHLLTLISETKRLSFIHDPKKQL